MERSRIKARATKGRTLTGDEPSAAPDQTAGKQKPEKANTSKGDKAAMTKELSLLDACKAYNAGKPIDSRNG